VADRTVRVNLSANAAQFVAGMRTAETSVQKFARSAVEAKAPYETLRRTLDLTTTAAHRLGNAGKDVGTHFAGSVSGVERLGTALKGLTTGTGVTASIKQIEKLATALRGLGNHGAASDLAALATHLHGLGSVNLTTVSSELRKLVAAINRVDPASATQLRNIVTALRAFSMTNVTTAADSLRALNTRLRTITAIPVSDIHALANALRALGTAAGGLGGAGAGPALHAMRLEINALQRALAQVRTTAGAGGSGSSGGLLGNITGGGLAKLAGMAGGALSFGAALKATIGITANFQTTMATLGVVTGQSGASLDAARIKAKELGADSTIAGASAADAATAMTELAKGGFNLADSMTAAKATLQLAAAAGVDAATAAGIQANALNAFSLKADQATRVANLLANTANAATGDIGDFALGMQQAGQPAAALGLSIEDTMTTLALFAKAGIKGSDAGTSLKSALLALETPTGKQITAMETLGLTVYDSTGKFVGMRKVSDELAAARKRMTLEEYNTTTALVFGSDAVRAAGILATNGGEGFDKMGKSIHDAGGVMEASEAKMSGISGAFGNLQNQVENAEISIGEKLSPAIIKATGLLAAAVPGISDALTGGGTGGLGSIGVKLGEIFTPLVTGARDLAVEIGPYLVSFGQSLVAGFKSWLEYVTPIAKAIGGFLSTIASNGTVKNFGAALVDVGKAFEAVARFLAPVGGWIADAIKWMGGLGPVVTTAVTALGAMVLLKGPLASLFSATLGAGFRTATSGFTLLSRQISFLQSQRGMSGLGATMTIIGSRAAGMGKALLGAFGGGWGLLITGAITALTLWAGANRDAAQKVEEHKAAVAELQQTVDQVTGALTAASAIKIGKDWQLSGADKQFQGIGHGAGEAAAAVVQGGKAVTDYRDKILATGAAVDWLAKRGDSKTNGGAGLIGYAKFAGISIDAVRKAALTGGPELDAMAKRLAVNGVRVGDVADTMRKFQASAVASVPALGTFNQAVADGGDAAYNAHEQFVIATTSAAGLAKIDPSKLVNALEATAKKGGTVEDALKSINQGGKTDQMIGALGDAVFTGANGLHYMTQQAAMAAKANTDVGDSTVPLATNFSELGDQVLGAVANLPLFGSGIDSSIIEPLGTAERALASFNPQLHFSIDDKGVETWTTDAQIELDAYKQKVTDAQTTTEIFFHQIQKLTGQDYGMQERLNDDAAQIRQVAAAFREQASAAADVEAKRAALKTAQANVGKTEVVEKTDSKGNKYNETVAASDATTPADVAEAARAYQAAMDAKTASAESFTKAQHTAVNAALDVVSATTTQVASTKGYSAAVNAGIAEMKKQRQAYVDSYIAGAQSSMTDDEKAASLGRITAEAGKAATGLGLIPDKKTVEFLMAGDNTDAIAKAKEVQAEKARVAKETKVRITADTKVANQDIAAFGTDIKKFPKSVRTTFDAKVADAKQLGRGLFEVYDKNAHKFVAQFLTKGEADAKVKAGEVLHGYDATTGDWTGQLVAKDAASTIIGGVQGKLDGVTDKTVDLKVRLLGTSDEATVTNNLGTGIFGTAAKAATGGMIYGPGTGTSDSIPTYLSNGEFVVRASETAKHRPLLERINSGAQSVAGYAKGGMVGGKIGGLNVNIGTEGNIDPALTGLKNVYAAADADVAKQNALVDKQIAAAKAAAALYTAASGLLGNNDPTTYGWKSGAAADIVPYSFHGVAFPGGVAKGTSPIWDSLLSALEPTIPGGIRPGEDWGYEDRDNVNNPGKKSMHAFGLALDVNSSENPNLPGTVGSRGNGKYEIPDSAGALAKAHNMLWGGAWGDAMHFELHETPQQVNGGGSSNTPGTGSGPVGSGVERWRPLALKVAAAKGYPAASVDVMLRQMDRESSGNPQAINLDDSNARAGHPSKGLLQFIDTTFADSADPGFGANIWDPESQMRAWYNYLAARYGGWEAYTHRGGDVYGAYATGGQVSGPGTGRSDSIPAMVSNGEFIVNSAATARHLPLLQSINGYANGGVVGYANGGAVAPSARNLSGQTDVTYGDRRNTVQAALDQFGPVLQEAAQAVVDARNVLHDALNDQKDSYRDYIAASKEYSKALAEQQATVKEASDEEKKTRKKVSDEETKRRTKFNDDEKKAQSNASADYAAAKTSAEKGQIAKTEKERHAAAVKEENERRKEQQADETERRAGVAKNASEQGKQAAEQLASALAAKKAAKATLDASNTAAGAARNAAASTIRHSNALKDEQRAQARHQRQLLVLSQEYDNLTPKLAAAKDKLAQLKSDRASAASSTSSTINGFDGGITGHNDTRTTYATILKGQQYDLKQVDSFARNLATLKAKGLGADAISQIANAGVDGGGVTAGALAKATKGQLKALNDLAALQKRRADAAGNTTAGAMYDAGIRSAQGLVAGLNAKEKDIAAAMVRLAGIASAAFKNALKIKSPSRVFHDHGMNIGKGVEGGVNASQPTVKAAIGNLVQVPTAPARIPVASAANQPMQIQVWLDGERIDARAQIVVNGALVELKDSYRKAGTQS
jgi:TP901 family phage tail tape measure protein